MAKRGTSKNISLKQENDLAEWYKGRRSPTSGAASGDRGDVRTKHTLIEAKVTGGPGNPKRASWVKIFEKIAEEAWLEGRDPALAFRFHDPESILANQNGEIDFVIRLVRDDIIRENKHDQT